MTLFPEVQRHAQEEIDNVVGDDRLPVLSDRPHLPYCDALYKEVLRYLSCTPLRPLALFNLSKMASCHPARSSTRGEGRRHLCRTSYSGKNNDYRESMVREVQSL